ncbi:MAG: fmdA [Deltaproteobacteria bacterium]|nr:fmdA [Deltaproteobacteria bacterium]
MKRILREQAKVYCFDRSLPPKLRVSPGEKFVVETEDASSGYLCKEGQSPLNRPFIDETWPPSANPVGGPIYIEGARRGDLLAIKIEDILVAADQSYTFSARRGPIHDSLKWSQAAEPYTHVLRHEPGIAVAPEREVLTSIFGQGIGGGNIDCRDMRPGNTFFVNSQNDGGLLFVGDVHASQGDTEFSGVAAETRAEVTLSVEIIPGKKISYPRIETPTSLISLYNSRPLEHAVSRAMFLLMEWMVEEYGFTRRDAYMQVSVNPGVRVHVYQMIPEMALLYTAGVEFPRDCL